MRTAAPAESQHETPTNPLTEATLQAPTLTSAERQAALKTGLPEHFEAYSDKYFLRTDEILRREGLNPWVRAQLFIRKGPGEVRGIDEAIAIIDNYSALREHGGRVYALKEGETYSSAETLMVIEAPIQDIIALETLYLGVLSSETTRVNDGVEQLDLDAAEETMRAVVSAAQGRPVSYFGARHWRYDQDAAIASAAFAGGATGASTDIGAATGGKTGQGTIPHALENIYAWKYGKERAVVEATLAFDRHIAAEIPRIALIDYNNREIDDSIAVARELGKNLAAVRVDTCGENRAQGALESSQDPLAAEWRAAGRYLPKDGSAEAKFWYGRGVTVTGVAAMRLALDAAGFNDVQIILTSGFGDPRKVEAFVDAEKKLGIRLFDSLGVGGIFHPCRTTTMDIVAVGDTPDSMLAISKVGRPYRPSNRLTLQLGTPENHGRSIT